MDGAIGLEFGGAISADLVHFVVAGPGDVDAGGFCGACLPDLPGAAAKGELARALAPPEHLLDALASALADRIAGGSGGSPVHGRHPRPAGFPVDAVA